MRVHVITALAIAGIAALLGLGTTRGVASPPSDYALEFDGVDDFVNVDMTPIAEALGAKSVITVEAWVRMESNATLGYKGIVMSAQGKWGLYHYGAPLNAQVGALISVPATASAVSNAALVGGGGTWMHVAMTYDGSLIRVYLDGVQTGVKEWPDFNWNKGLTFHIGRWLSSGGFRGLIDEVRLWSYARSGLQIASDRHKILPSKTPGLVAYYRFEKEPGQSVSDSGPHGAHGSLGATTAAGSDDPVWVGEGAPVQ